MTLFKSMMIAFSMYSNIPVPQFEWKEKEMKYTLCFFPFIGAVIGGIFYFFSFLCFHYQVGTVFYTFIGTAIPLFLSGGIHTDGYMDTMDAFHSYQPGEKKLEILKDSHIGAFSVIMLVLYYLVYAGALSEVRSLNNVLFISFGFVLSRTLSGIGVVTFKAAKKSGLLYTFASAAHKCAVKTALYLQLVLVIGIMCKISLLRAVVVIICGGSAFLYYRYKSYKELNGITGDTAGYFLTICECFIVVGIAIIELTGR